MPPSRDNILRSRFNITAPGIGQVVGRSRFRDSNGLGTDDYL
jgi:hypothetical protein